MTRISRFALALAVVLPAQTARAAILTMGTGGTYPTLAAAVAAASAGDTILVEPGTYDDQYAYINTPVTIDGNGAPGQVVFTQTLPELPGLKGYLITNANTTVENITFQDAAISLGDGDNAAGIRYQAGNLTVINDRFNNNQDGILATPATTGTGTIVIMNSSFTGNGVASGPLAGYEHGIYIGGIASLSVTGSTFQGTLMGHDIKSRAANNTISDNTIDDGLTGTPSYGIDLPDGGVDTVSYNTIDKGPNTQNDTIIAYSEEDPGNAVWPTNSLLVLGNLFDNTNYSAIGVNNESTSVVAEINCNAFNNVTTIVSGAATLSGNVIDGSVPACGQQVPEPSGLPIALSWLTLLAAIRWFGTRHGLQCHSLARHPLSRQPLARHRLAGWTDRVHAEPAEIGAFVCRQ
jgi:hypothetical protein